MSVEVYSELPKLTDALQAYQEVTGKSMTDILAKEGKEWTYVLNDLFKEISPKPRNLAAAAAARSWRMGRRGNSITPALDGLSTLSLDSARALLGGQKSDYFRTVLTSDGITLIRRARFSGKANRKTGIRRLLMGGRKGNQFAASALRAGQVEEPSLREAMKRGDIRQLNLRAVATAIELNRRAQAAKGGTMGLQWLVNVYRKRSSSVMKTGPLVSRSTRNIPLGEITFEADAHGDLSAVNLIGYVPGTAAQARKHGIPERADAIRAADRLAYVRRKMQESAQAAFKKK